LDAKTVIAVQKGAEAQGERLAFYLRPATGFPLPVLAAGKAKGRVITLRLDATEKELGQEGYTLSVKPGKVILVALKERGLFYGIQTIRQLLPPAIFRDVPVPGPDWSMPAVEIRDVPRFGWRGLMLDCCRHYMPKHFIKRLVDLAALHKLNSVHLHLTEDQGWRLEIKKYPKLTQVGAWRPGSLVGHQSDPCRTFDKIPHGGFYTQDDMREIVRYAQDRMVTIVPEIELPGHAQAAVTAYPELGVTGRAVGVRQEWGISQFDTFLQAQGRRLIGWDEILEGGLAAGATVMSWRGVDGGIKAA
jgi:hexosaminidase